MPATIFVIDSSPAVRRMVEQISTPEGYQVIGFQDGSTALEAARKLSPALIIADFHLENMTFSGFCKEIGQQDHLSETLIVSLLDASDRLDESKLRSLGVRAYLKKPFHSEQLLDTVKGILSDAAAQLHNKKPAKARTWPPASTAIGDEHDDMPRDASTDDAPASDEAEKEQTTMPPLSARAAAPSPSTGPAVSGFGGGEEMMKCLFNHLLQSVALQADRKINDLLPSAVAKEVTEQVSHAVQAAVREETTRQLAEALPQERLQRMLRELVQETLNRQATTQLAAVETAVRQACSDLAPPLVEQSAERLLSGFAETEVKKHLPEALQKHRETIAQLVKGDVEQTAVDAARQAAKKAEEMVREMARDPIRQAVQRIVPDLAEAQVREEIKRLSQPD
ncbi:MAG: Response regulator receiver protein [Nitrospira sp.]|nr:MAG: Response regulator receiver protein [Nitrospira sp.]